MFFFCFNPTRVKQNTTQYRNDDTVITTATGVQTTAEEFLDDFFGEEYKYDNRW